MAGRALKPKVTLRPEALERVKKKLEERAKETKALDHTVSVGIHEAEGSQEKDDYHGKPQPISLAQVATIHEYNGRSWLRTWFDQNRTRLSKEMTAAARAAYREHSADPIEKQGEAWAEELRGWIEYQDGGLKALLPSTIEAKQKAGLENPSVPLVATHQLVSAIKSMLDGR